MSDLTYGMRETVVNTDTSLSVVLGLVFSSQAKRPVLLSYNHGWIKVKILL